MKHRRQSHAARITLLACILVALLPTTGLTFCIGRGGDHFGVGVAVTVTAQSCDADGGGSICPCEALSRELLSLDTLSPSTDSHCHPCRDVVITAPQLYFGGHGTVHKLAVPWDLDGGLPPADMIVPARRPTGGVIAPATETRGDLVRAALRDGRTIVLLI